MRKADYMILANTIKRHIAGAYEAAAAARSGSQPGAVPESYEGKAAGLEWLADCFAREASVDCDTFLRACGLRP
jgi:hypothetical protein